MLHQPITPAIDTADTRAEALLASLATVEAMAVSEGSLSEARCLAEKIRFHRQWGSREMLGKNGIAPAVESCLRGALAIQDMRHTAERTLTQPEVFILHEDWFVNRFPGLTLALAAATLASSPAAPAVLPRPAPRILAPVQDRKDRKKKERQRAMGKHQIGRNRKLARRLRRKCQLGRFGAF